MMSQARPPHFSTKFVGDTSMTYPTQTGVSPTASTEMQNTPISSSDVSASSRLQQEINASEMFTEETKTLDQDSEKEVNLLAPAQLERPLSVIKLI